MMGSRLPRKQATYGRSDRHRSRVVNVEWDKVCHQSTSSDSTDTPDQNASITAKGSLGADKPIQNGRATQNLRVRGRGAPPAPNLRLMASDSEDSFKETAKNQQACDMFDSFIDSPSVAAKPTARRRPNKKLVANETKDKKPARKAATGRKKPTKSDVSSSPDLCENKKKKRKNAAGGARAKSPGFESRVEAKSRIPTVDFSSIEDYSLIISNSGPTDECAWVSGERSIDKSAFLQHGRTDRDVSNHSDCRNNDSADGWNDAWDDFRNKASANGRNNAAAVGRNNAAADNKHYIAAAGKSTSQQGRPRGKGTSFSAGIGSLTSADNSKDDLFLSECRENSDKENAREKRCGAEVERARRGRPTLHMSTAFTSTPQGASAAKSRLASGGGKANEGDDVSSQLDVTNRLHLSVIQRDYSSPMIGDVSRLSVCLLESPFGSAGRQFGGQMDGSGALTSEQRGRQAESTASSLRFGSGVGRLDASVLDDGLGDGRGGSRCEDGLSLTDRSGSLGVSASKGPNKLRSTSNGAQRFDGLIGVNGSLVANGSVGNIGSVGVNGSRGRQVLFGDRSGSSSSSASFGVFGSSQISDLSNFSDGLSQDTTASRRITSSDRLADHIAGSNAVSCRSMHHMTTRAAAASRDLLLSDSMVGVDASLAGCTGSHLSMLQGLSGLGASLDDASPGGKSRGCGLASLCGMQQGTNQLDFFMSAMAQRDTSTDSLQQAFGISAEDAAAVDCFNRSIAMATSPAASYHDNVDSPRMMVVDPELMESEQEVMEEAKSSEEVTSEGALQLSAICEEEEEVFALEKQLQSQDNTIKSGKSVESKADEAVEESRGSCGEEGSSSTENENDGSEGGGGFDSESENGSDAAENACVDSEDVTDGDIDGRIGEDGEVKGCEAKMEAGGGDVHFEGGRSLRDFDRDSFVIGNIAGKEENADNQILADTQDVECNQLAEKSQKRLNIDVPNGNAEPANSIIVSAKSDSSASQTLQSVIVGSKANSSAVSQSLNFKMAATPQSVRGGVRRIEEGGRPGADCLRTPLRVVDQALLDELRQSCRSVRRLLTPMRLPRTGRVPSARDKVLVLCEQTKPLPFNQFLTKKMRTTCVKIGEGVYGEVFRARRKNEFIALKVIPIEGSQLVNDEKQKTFEEIVSEIVISKQLSALRSSEEYHCENFVHVKRVSLVSGRYPAALLESWDRFHESKQSMNDRPDMFGDDQHYVVFTFEDGGSDLEGFPLHSLQEARSVLRQICAALAVAESALEFEHRDLHWGNILVRHDPAATSAQTYRMRGGREVGVETCGVAVTVIDFTLSRLYADGCQVYTDLSTDDALFAGKSDYQFDIYRLMKKENQDDWASHHPHTNVLWLHYLLLKLLKHKEYGKDRSHATMLRRFRGAEKKILEYGSCVELMLNCSFFAD